MHRTRRSNWRSARRWMRRHPAASLSLALLSLCVGVLLGLTAERQGQRVMGPAVFGGLGAAILWATLRSSRAARR